MTAVKPRWRARYVAYVFGPFKPVVAAVLRLLWHVHSHDALPEPQLAVRLLAEMLLDPRADRVSTLLVARCWRMYACIGLHEEMDVEARAACRAWLDSGFGAGGDVELLHKWDCFPFLPFLTDNEREALAADFGQRCVYDCLCGNEKASANWVECGSGPACMGRRWYHWECVGFGGGDFTCPSCKLNEHEGHWSLLVLDDDRLG